MLQYASCYNHDGMEKARGAEVIFRDLIMMHCVLIKSRRFFFFLHYLIVGNFGLTISMGVDSCGAENSFKDITMDPYNNDEEFRW